MDYECERGAKRNFEPWREAKLAEETEEERLDRLEREEAEYDPMKELESKVLDAKQEMAIADALDEIRSRNARIEKADKDITDVPEAPQDIEYQRQDEEDTAAARKAFEAPISEDTVEEIVSEPVIPIFERKVKTKKTTGALVKPKLNSGAKSVASSLPKPTSTPTTALLLAGYGSDDD